MQSNVFRDSTVPKWIYAEHSTGTSIMAIEYEGGVIIGADSRTTTGPYIANRVADKLTKLTDAIYCCRSGTSSDTQAIADVVKYHMNLQLFEMDEPPLVATVAHVVRENSYNTRDSLSASFIVAGWDSRLGGQVYEVPQGGMIIRQKIAIGGSGGKYITGYVDAQAKENMTKEEGVNLITNSLTLAMARDGYSGGVIRLAVIDMNGVDRRTILGNQLPRFYDG